MTWQELILGYMPGQFGEAAYTTGRTDDNDTTVEQGIGWNSTARLPGNELFMRNGYIV